MLCRADARSSDCFGNVCGIDFGNVGAGGLNEVVGGESTGFGGFFAETFVGKAFESNSSES